MKPKSIHLIFCFLFIISCSDDNISSSEKVEIVRKGSTQVNIREVDKNEYEKFPAMKKFAIADVRFSLEVAETSVLINNVNAPAPKPANVRLMINITGLLLINLKTQWTTMIRFNL